MSRSVAVNLAWLAAYLAIVGSLVAWLVSSRPRLIAHFSRASSQQSWENFREEARRQEQGEGPVKRRVPKSEQPNMAVLLEDHFEICIAAAIIFPSLLFFATMFFIRGAVNEESA